MDVLPENMFVHLLCAWCRQKPEEGIRSPGAIDGSELPFVC